MMLSDVRLSRSKVTNVSLLLNCGGDGICSILSTSLISKLVLYVSPSFTVQTVCLSFLSFQDDTTFLEGRCLLLSLIPFSFSV